MRPIICAALMVAVLGGSGSALAQRVGVEVYADEPSYYWYRDPAPRTYGYRAFEERPTVVIPVRPTSCGEFWYWNGERCVDARVIPPDVR